MTTIDCVICGRKDCQPFAERGGVRLYRCSGCSSLSADTQVTQEFLDATYGDGEYHAKTYPAARYKRKVRQAHRRLAIIEMVTKPGRVLDIGCGAGYSMEAANARGWDAYGVDVSPHIVSECRQRGLQTSVGSINNTGHRPEFFDVVTLFHVLEHAPDPHDGLEEMQRVLKPGGCLWLEVPSMERWKARLQGPRYRHLWSRGHVLFFSRSALVDCLKAHGFMPKPLPLLTRYAAHPLRRFSALAFIRNLTVKVNQAVCLSKILLMCAEKKARPQQELECQGGGIAEFPTSRRCV